MKKTYIIPSITLRPLRSEGLIAASIVLSDDEIGTGDDFTFAPKKNDYWGGDFPWNSKGDWNSASE